MAKYLLLDQNGVLDGEYVDYCTIEDLRLAQLSPHTFKIIPEGILMLSLLWELKTNHGYQLVFHSKNTLPNQLALLNQLQTAARAQDKEFPAISALAECDEIQYPAVTSDKPRISSHPAGIQIASFGVPQIHKKCVRSALEKLLSIGEHERKENIIFDDDEDVIKSAMRDGYQAFHITPTFTLAQALAKLLATLKD